MQRALGRGGVSVLVLPGDVAHAPASDASVATDLVTTRGRVLPPREQTEAPARRLDAAGKLGYGACYDAMHEADLVVLPGTDFPYDDFLPQARTVQVDHGAGNLGRRSVLELGVHGDLGETLRAVLPLVRQKEDPSFRDHSLHRHAKALEHVMAA